MPWSDPELFSVSVPGGEVTVGRWGEGATPVLASHGITANHRSFGQLAWALREAGADATLYAIDHRGRGGSSRHPGPFGLQAHAEDLLRVLDVLSAPPSVLVGHSMGAFVAANAAERDPGRIAGLVLIDGALPIEVGLPADTDIETVVRSVIGPALDRLDKTFSSPDAYLDLWRQHPAFQGEDFNDVAEAYFLYDLERAGSVWRSPVSKQAVLEDGKGPLQDTPARTALARTTVPTTLLWAPRGLLDQQPGLYPADVVASATADLPHVTAVEVSEVNHYSILMSERGAQRVAETVGSLLP